MAISYRETAELSCPDCRTTFPAVVWLLLDIDEEPQAAAELAADQLNRVRCPACGDEGPAGAPLMVHDGRLRRVLFAPTPGAADHELREQARDLHALLVGSIDEAARGPYLADVDISADSAGLARQTARLLRRRGGGASAAAGTQRDEVSARPAAGPDPVIALQAALEELLAADDAAELQLVVQRHPVLIDPTTAATIGQLASAAEVQGEAQIAGGLRRAAQLLRQVGGTSQQLTALPPAVLAELLAAVDEAALETVVGRHPLLLDPAVDQLLAEEVATALSDGDSRLADALELRRDALQRLRGEPNAPELEAAVEALLLAEDQEACGLILSERPLLLSDAAEDALWRVAAEARRSGDDDLARYAVECRALIKRVRRTEG
jgi:hypothetical protein